jgi:D-alanyl-lipoteichoic acid acyltransferase DltB (MBOAT superfamily)
MKRIIVGVFKKFVVADSLALIALNPQNAAQTSSPLWMWVLLYAFCFRIYLDFSGYTDIAIGIGNFLGFNLPENFNRSYLQPNVTTFWNNWHMTLTNWFRAYFFNPITRALRASKREIPIWVIIFFGQMGTMVLIGLWHGVTWNFIVWGVWHGLGLFLHNRWSSFSKSLKSFEDKPLTIQRFTKAAGVLLTFNFVALGWVWFALPSTDQSLQVFASLFGM